MTYTLIFNPLEYANSRDSPVYDNLVDIDAPAEVDLIKYTPLQDIPDTALGVGSMVEVSIPEASENLYGVIRWIGMAQGRNQIMVGVELEEDQDDRNLPTTNGIYNGVRYAVGYYYMFKKLQYYVFYSA